MANATSTADKVTDLEAMDALTTALESALERVDEHGSLAPSEAAGLLFLELARAFLPLARRDRDRLRAEAADG